MLKEIKNRQRALTISVNNPEKRSKSRTLKVSAKLAAMLIALPKENQLMFKDCNTCTWEHNFHQTRRKLAAKLQNPRLERITFHTLRHWKATMEYAKTKDILHVMRLLGHKNIQNTLIYTQLANFESEEFHSAVAKNVEEARNLIEIGFEFVCDIDNVKLFRKRK